MDLSLRPMTLCVCVPMGSLHCIGWPSRSVGAATLVWTRSSVESGQEFCSNSHQNHWILPITR